MVDKDARLPIVADHNCIDINKVPSEWAKSQRGIAYRIRTYISWQPDYLWPFRNDRFKGEPFTYRKGSPKGSLDLRDNPFGGEKGFG